MKPALACSLLILALALPGRSLAENGAAGFAAANRLFDAGKYSEAVDIYQRLAGEDPCDPAVLFNLGNAYFRRGGAGDLGHAIASYERAFDLSPRDPDLRHNLDLALKRSGESLIPAGMPAVAFVLFHSLSLEELRCSHWAAFWAFCLLASAALWREPLRARLKPYAAGAAALWALAGAAWSLRVMTAVANPAVIVAPDAEARSGPGLNFPVNFKAPEGRRVSVVQEADGFVEVGVLKEGLKGWIPAEQLERLY